MPLLAATFVWYACDVAMTSPFVASRLNWNLPALFFFRTNFAGTVASWTRGSGTVPDDSQGQTLARS